MAVQRDGIEPAVSVLTWYGSMFILLHPLNPAHAILERLERVQGIPVQCGMGCTVKKAVIKWL